MTVAMVPIGEAFLSVRNGKSVNQDKSGKGFAVSRIETISDGTVDSARVGYSRDDVSDSDPNWFEPGDVLFSHINSPDRVGQVALYEGTPHRLFHGINLLRLRPDRSAVEPRYALYLFRTPGFRARLRNFVNQAVNQASVSATNLKSIAVALPPIEEQRRIAAVLDAADALRAKRRQAIARLDTLTQAIFIDMFGDPLATGESERGELGQLVEFVGGGTPSKSNESFFSGEICWATSKDMKSRYLDDTQDHITEEAIAASATKLVSPGTVLVVVKSKVLAHTLPVAIARVPTCFGQDLKGLRPVDGVPSEYVAASLRVSARWLLRQARGVNTEGLTLDQLRRCPVPKALPGDMEAFAESARNINTRREALQRSSAELETLFASLQQSAFRGEL